MKYGILQTIFIHKTAFHIFSAFATGLSHVLVILPKLNLSPDYG